MQSYRRLRVTGRAREVIRSTYEFTRGLPREEQFGLTSQMRRAAISIGLNIAEGCSRRGTRELIRFLEFSIGSAMELDFGLLICEDLGYGSAIARKSLYELNRIGQRELAALIRSLRHRVATGDRA
ncbi:MAG TPA: four helix bundle protein [Gemmatimonadaceae bacterium]